MFTITTPPECGMMVKLAGKTDLSAPNCWFFATLGLSFRQKHDILDEDSKESSFTARSVGIITMQNRIRAYLDQRHQVITQGSSATTTEAAFVACPVFHCMSHGQQAQVMEIYRIAAELTRQQMQKQLSATRSRIPEFSMN